MNQAQATEKILAAWVASWPTLSSNVAFSLDNEPASDSPTYAIVAIRSGPSSNHTLGSSSIRQQRTGSIDVKIVGSIDAGRGPLDVLAQHVRTIFERKRLSFAAGDDIVCLETSCREVSSDPARWALILSTRFWFYEAG